MLAAASLSFSRLPGAGRVESLLKRHNVREMRCILYSRHFVYGFPNSGCLNLGFRNKHIYFFEEIRGPDLFLALGHLRHVTPVLVIEGEGVHSFCLDFPFA